MRLSRSQHDFWYNGQKSNRWPFNLKVFLVFCNYKRNKSYRALNMTQDWNPSFGFWGVYISRTEVKTYQIIPPLPVLNPQPLTLTLLQTWNGSRSEQEPTPCWSGLQSPAGCCCQFIGHHCDSVETLRFHLDSPSRLYSPSFCLIHTHAKSAAESFSSSVTPSSIPHLVPLWPIYSSTLLLSQHFLFCCFTAGNLHGFSLIFGNKL